MRARPADRVAPPERVASEDHPGVIAPAPLLYAAAFVVGAMLHAAFPATALPVDLAPWSAAALLASGAILAVSSRRTLEAAGTNADPTLPATTLVVTGPYGFSRNPMYVARTLLYLGLGLTMNALGVLATLVPVLPIVHYGVVKREERYLEGKFGDAYRRYRSRVRRWL
jgi:protein-S-isoprenylcysteine O-methyltransferase Ste14